MINLAGSPQDVADDATRRELEVAGIPVFDGPTTGEVRTNISGRLGPIRFARRWCYWSVTGPVPIATARELFARGERSIRVAGHCAGPPPDEWARWWTPNGDGIVDQDQYDDYIRLRLPTDGIVFTPDPSQFPGAYGTVHSYHIDTQDGLTLFAQVVRDALVQSVYDMAITDPSVDSGPTYGRVEVATALGESGWSPWQAARRLGYRPTAESVFEVSSRFGGGFW